VQSDMSVVHTLRARRALPSTRACGEGAPDLQPAAGVPEVVHAARLMSSSARVEHPFLPVMLPAPAHGTPGACRCFHRGSTPKNDSRTMFSSRYIIGRLVRTYLWTISILTRILATEGRHRCE
jgi:hypothetical protein